MKKPSLCVSVATATFAMCLLWGCASAPNFTHEEIRLREQDTLPSRMMSRADLVDVSDCRVVFDLSAIPEFVGIPLVKYNPFDDHPAKAKSALCPMRIVMQQVLNDGSARVFRGGMTSAETVIKLMPMKIGLDKQGTSVHCAITCSAMIGGEAVSALEAERTSFWRNEADVPDCAYQAAADIGDKILNAIAQSGRLKTILEKDQAQGPGTPPKADKWQFTAIKDGGFSGGVEVDCGTWDMARVQQWTRNQIEGTARAKLGVATLDNYRILMGWQGKSSGKVSIPFSVFPYQGFEVQYDSNTRKGECIADMAFLGLDEQTAYNKAVIYIERILKDQGIVKTAGQAAEAAQYRFNGYRTAQSGTKIEIPFELVQ